MAKMKQSNKRDYIDKLNNEFVKLSVQNGYGEYKKFYEKIFDKILTKYEKNGKISLKEIREVIDTVQLKDNNMKFQIVSSIMLSGITNVIENQKLDKEDKDMFLPIAVLVAAYSITKPDILAKKTITITKGILSNDYTKLSVKDKQIAKGLKKFINSNTKTIEKNLSLYNTKNKKDIKRVKRNLTTSIDRDIKRQSKVKVRVYTKDGSILVNQTKDDIKKFIKTKYQGQIQWRIKRYIETETHSMIEQVKYDMHNDLGYTKKTWVTQRDRDVRKSHNKLQGKKIDIDKKFRVGGSWAMHPSDKSLPPKEYFNCRCFLVYTKQ